ncbi:hypothetical protein [Streptomyces sp. NPDC001135]
MGGRVWSTANLRAVQAGATKAARDFADAEPRMPELLVDVAERIVVPVTAESRWCPDLSKAPAQLLIKASPTGSP